MGRDAGPSLDELRTALDAAIALPVEHEKSLADEVRSLLPSPPNDERAQPIGEALREAVQPVLDREARRAEVLAARGERIQSRLEREKLTRKIKKSIKRLSKNLKKGK